MNLPLISVILATFNGSRYIAEAIESVLGQEYKNLELIIIDDASTDRAVQEIIATYIQKDNRISSYRNEKNMERSWSKNFGVSQAKGDYVAFIDDDDIWKKEKLKEQMEVLMTDTSIGIVGTFADFIDESGKSLGMTSHMKIASQDIKDNILFTNQFIHSSVLVRKNIFQSVSGFPLDMHLCEDYDLWLRILRTTEAHNIAKPLVYYRVRVSSTTAKNLYAMKVATIRLVWKYRTYFPHGWKALIFKTLIFAFPIPLLFRIRDIIFRKKKL